MELKSFRVRCFRSIKDTGWIDASRVTALIGTNESGKSNVLLALWKFKPARDGAIDLLADCPRSIYHRIKDSEQKPTFVEVQYELCESDAETISDLVGRPEQEVSKVQLSRSLDGTLRFSFPDSCIEKEMLVKPISKVAKVAIGKLDSIDTNTDRDSTAKANLQNTIKDATSRIQETADKLACIREFFGNESRLGSSEDTAIAAIYDSFLLELIASAVYDLAPHSVYYANYGNLDSEIYLPHVIENLDREDLRGVTAEKTRTLRVLFEFVKLKPIEIRDLGRESEYPNNPSQDEQIQIEAKNKKERDILLQSASTSLTQDFRDWWRQGNHRFRFQADGNHFRIWVSDDVRPEDVELESRSAGLQWFLSFFLIFLVECKGSLKNAILLLDEPGVSLHPIAQEDLSGFFDKLSEDNQVFYTSHSPFLINADQLDRVRTVYYDDVGEDKGLTKVSADLRVKEKSKGQIKSIYAVYAALEISVSKSLLLGSSQIIVEGPSDQHYLSAIKSFLIGRGLVKPERELLFLPTGGARGVKAVVPIIAGRDGKLPIIVLDGDDPGKQTAKRLKGDLYAGQTERIISLSDVVGVDEAEVEDLIPTRLYAWAVVRMLGVLAYDVEEEFTEYINEDDPNVEQVERYAKEYAIDLPEGWKVDVAKRVKERLLSKKFTDDDMEEEVVVWQKLFEMFNDEA